MTLLHPRTAPCTDACTRESDCPYWVDSRARATPEGRQRIASEYHQAVIRAAEAVTTPPEAASRLSSLGVPSAALTAALSAGTTEALSAAKTWWASKEVPSLVLVGDVGCGKTTACAWVALEVGLAWPWNSLPRMADGDVPLVWLDGPRLSRLSRYDSEAADVLDVAAVAPLLVVDDAGREGSRPAVEALLDVLTERLDGRKRTILSTNLKGEAFRARYGAPLADRLKSGGHVVALRGPSMRGSK